MSSKRTSKHNRPVELKHTPYWACKDRHDNYNAWRYEALKSAYIEARRYAIGNVIDFKNGIQTACWILDSGLVIRVSRIEGEQFTSWRKEYGHRSFDLPILNSGVIRDSYGEIIVRWCVCPRADAITEAQDEQWVNLVRTIHDEGYETRDLEYYAFGSGEYVKRYDQTGIVDGKAVLLDYECAAR